MSPRDAKIYRTTVTYGAQNDRVRLEISDGDSHFESTDDMDGFIRLTLEAKIPAFASPLMEHVQIKAVEAAIAALDVTRENLVAQLNRAGSRGWPPLRG